MSGTGRLLGAVLAGGAGRRFGGPKAGVPVAGVPMVRRAAEALAPVCADVVVVSSRPVPDAPAPVIPDATEGAGPLGGLEAALLEARRRGLAGVFLLACDLPLVSPEVVARVAAAVAGGAAAAPPREGGGVEATCAVYGVGCLDAVRARLSTSDRSLQTLFTDVAGVVVPRAAGDADAGGDPFLNVNTPAERARAEALLGREGAS